MGLSLDRLNELGFAEDTIVVRAPDNGAHARYRYEGLGAWFVISTDVVDAPAASPALE